MADDTFEEFSSWDSSLSVSSLAEDYRAGIQPEQVVQAIYARIAAYKEVQPSVWIHLQPLDIVLCAAKEIHARWPEEASRPPLWGIPFSVKDSIDVAGIPTTVGCPALAYTPATSAAVYQKCIDAGGLFIGKTNLEQLATGATGCRSPYGTLHSTFSKLHIVGGSSSGGAVSVSEGLVSFALGSDTAGSIRIPALYNGLVGFKPTKGTVSARGLFPACAHQDCASFLALTTEDAENVWKICKGFDREDIFAKRPVPERPKHQPFSSFRFGIPPESVLDTCTPIYRQQFNQVIKTLKESGGKLIELDWTPISGANELLYNSTFLSERLTILPEGWFDKNKNLLHPVTRQIFEGAIATKSPAVNVFRDLHKQAKYKREVENMLFPGGADGEELTVIVVPTAPSHPTIEEVMRDPIGTNASLGVFSWFANVLDLVGLAIPCGSYEVEVEGERPLRLPFGVTILAGCGLDQELLTMGKALEEDLGSLEHEG
jgi:allophanate hydrolase